MVEMNTQGDVFSTVDAPKNSSAANQEVAMPKHDHPLQAEAVALDSLFWAKSVGSEGTAEAEETKIEEEWREMKSWLSSFDAQLKAAVILMGQAAADESRPFQEKYEAREMLKDLCNEVKESWLGQSAVMKAVKALIFNRLGQNYYDAEEISESESQMQ